MAIKTRTQLKTWFSPAYKLIPSRITAWFDSFLHLEDDVKVYDITSANQIGDYSATITHNLDASNLIVSLEEQSGEVITGIKIVNNYVTGKCNSTTIYYSDSLGSDTNKFNIIKLK